MEIATSSIRQNGRALRTIKWRFAKSIVMWRYLDGGLASHDSRHTSAGVRFDSYSELYVADAQSPTYSMRHLGRESNRGCTKWTHRWAVQNVQPKKQKLTLTVCLCLVAEWFAKMHMLIHMRASVNA
jgi:hypothetical protein